MAKSEGELVRCPCCAGQGCLREHGAASSSPEATMAVSWSLTSVCELCAGTGEVDAETAAAWRARRHRGIVELRGTGHGDRGEGRGLEGGPAPGAARAARVGGSMW